MTTEINTDNLAEIGFTYTIFGIRIILRENQISIYFLTFENDKIYLKIADKKGEYYSSIELAFKDIQEIKCFIDKFDETNIKN
jgi:hypothetical protein